MKKKWGDNIKMPGLLNEMGLIKRLNDYEVPDEMVFFYIEEVAAILKVSVATIKININSGNIEACRLFKRSKGMDRISLKELKRIVREGIDFRKTIGKERDRVQKKRIENLQKISRQRKRIIDKQRNTIEALKGGLNGN